MRVFLIYLSMALASINARILEVLSLIAAMPGFKQVLVVVAEIRDQVARIRYTFAKRPCSATGGTA